MIQVQTELQVADNTGAKKGGQVMIASWGGKLVPLTRNPNKWVGNQEKKYIFFFSKSKSGLKKMSTLHFSSDIGLGPGPLADP